MVTVIKTFGNQRSIAGFFDDHFDAVENLASRRLKEVVHPDTGCVVWSIGEEFASHLYFELHTLKCGSLAIEIDGKDYIQLITA